MDLENIMSIMSNLKIIQVQNIYLYIYILQKIVQVQKCGLRKCYEFPENNIGPKICTLHFIHVIMNNTCKHKTKLVSNSFNQQLFG